MKDEPKGERRCAVGVGPQGEPVFEQFVRLDWANAENDRLKAELARIVIDVPEYFCRRCNTIHAPQGGLTYHPCPVCRDAMEPTSYNLREIAALKERLGIVGDTAEANIQFAAELRAENERLKAELAEARKVMRDIPDPEDEGVCPNCSRMELKRVGDYYKWQHSKDYCWYFRLQAALEKK